MAPEDVLIEAIVLAAKYGDSPDLRQQQCARLIRSIQDSGLYQAIPFIRDNGSPAH